MSEEVRYWFAEAVRLPAGSRLAFLESRCLDEAVRSDVLSLLEHDVEDTSSSPAAIAGTVRCLLRNDGATIPAQRVGAFELGRLLGSGGMGLVYEAHRIDGHVRQRVAVKFAQVSATASEKSRNSIFRRFFRERQVLASLRHPYIAGLIDAGTTVEGIPYAVIEQVDGVPIDSYCDSCLPAQTERIRLVLKLCDAVQFAHRNLIVHSDIKPDNILVTADGIPKLIDFGVASDLGEEATLSTVRAFTPGYASPEQISGLRATVATDVYGIGAVLYRLLAGTKPRPANTGSFTGSIRTIWEKDVLRPSAITPELKGDLENILLKAMQREPDRRYGSVPELADDLNRLLAHRPVRASPDSALYRANRFVRRYWVQLAATATLIFALAAVSVFSVREREHALARAEETRRLAATLLFGVHDEIGGLVGGTRARERLGAIAVQYLEGLEGGHGQDPELAWELLNAYARLGQSRGGAASSLGDTESGWHFASKALALGAVVEKAASNNDRLDRLFAVYESLVPVFLEAGRPIEQHAAIDRMLRLAPQLSPLREAQALKQLAHYFDENGSPRQAAEVWARSLAVLRSLSRASVDAVEADAQLSSTLVGFGRAQALAGNFSGAVASLREAIRLSEARWASQPQTTRTARQLYWSHIALGDVFGSPARFNLGRPADAVEHYQTAESIAQRLVNADPANDIAKLDLATAFSREAVVLAASRPARALALLERCHSLAMRTSARNHSRLDAQFTYLTSAVSPLVRLGQPDRARLHILEARRLLKQTGQREIATHETALLKAEATYLYATGLKREALRKAQEHLAMMPMRPSAILNENFATVELLERIRLYAANLDPRAYASASERLVRIWQDLRRSYPNSDFVRRQAVQPVPTSPARPPNPRRTHSSWQGRS